MTKTYFTDKVAAIVTSKAEIDALAAANLAAFIAAGNQPSATKKQRNRKVCCRAKNSRRVIVGGNQPLPVRSSMNWSI